MSQEITETSTLGPGSEEAVPATTPASSDTPAVQQTDGQTPAPPMSPTLMKRDSEMSGAVEQDDTVFDVKLSENMSDQVATSRRLFRLLDGFGYSMKMIAIRRKMYKRHAVAVGTAINCKVVICGSKGDGLSKSRESDTDILIFRPHHFYIQEEGNMQTIPEYMQAFLAINRPQQLLCPPGYCMLEYVRTRTVVSNAILKSLEPFKKEAFISSEGFMVNMASINNSNPEHREVTGPAITNTISTGEQFDYVNTFSFKCHQLLQTWAQRERLHDWPPLTVRQDIPKMSGNLVATGRKGSPTSHLEWRYCFNEVELLLTETLNDTQMKLYKMLKIINNDILKTSGFSLSSYMIKNVVYWLAEAHPQATFVPEMLFHWVIEALKMLEHAADTNMLPYYMIPGRNLFTEKIKETDRLPLKAKIREVIESGPAVLVQCKTLHRVMSMTSELDSLQQLMEKLEMCDLHLETRIYEQKANNALWDPEKDELIHKLSQRMYKIMDDSSWPESVKKEIRAHEDVIKARKMLLG